MNEDTWTTTDARAHFDEIVERATADRPQRIKAPDGTELEVRRLAGKKPQIHLLDLLKLAPLGGLEIPPREKSFGRDPPDFG